MLLLMLLLMLPLCAWIDCRHSGCCCCCWLHRSQTSAPLTLCWLPTTLLTPLN
jgi:hypothetical protein